MSKNLSFLTFSFFLGYVASGLINQNPIISAANASITNMSYSELVRNRDFRKAVMAVAEEECRTDIRLKGKVKTWFSCGNNSSYAP